MKIETLQARRDKLAAKMVDGSFAVILSTNAPKKTADQLYEFCVWRNFLYFTNIDRPNMAFVLKKTGNHVQDFLFIDEVSEMEEKWSGARMRKNVASATSGIKEENIFSMDKLRTTIGGWMMGAHSIEHAYFDFDRTSYTHLDTEQITFAKELHAKYPQLQLHDLHIEVAKLRAIKSEEEVANLRKAIAITKEGIEAMLKISRPGLNEYEFDAYFNFALKMGGSAGPGYHSIIASGANATVLHYEDNNMVVNDSDLVLLDLGALWNHYSADISRTFPVNGKFTGRQADVYQAVLDVEKATIEKIRPGIKMSELTTFAKDSLAQKAKNLGLSSDISNYYYHGIGHALGLDVHDVGGRDFTLETGMIITIEPGLYIADEAIGVRIEDNILVTATGHENLSQDIIKEIADIEAFMAK